MNKIWFIKNETLSDITPVDLQLIHWAVDHFEAIFLPGTASAGLGP